MNKGHKNIVLWTILIWLAGSIAMPARAENHALLIGIGKYRQRTLEGPPYDVAALARVLASQYGFQKENIRTLLNEAAVKFRILSELELLTSRTRPGDRIFIYFSGHGTSRRDQVLALPLPHTTGALVPADFEGDPAQPVEKLMSQLIIGKRDLRPALERLDRDRQVLMVFDTCFSGNTVRAIGNHQAPNLSRYLPLQSRSVFKAEQEIGGFEENITLPEPYPYQNIFYISAATENEVAKDIQQNNLYLFPTIDGNPHGVLTDALLRALTGQLRVDTDNDERWSQIELYAAIKKEVQRRFKQSPQALPKEGSNADRLYSRTFFVRTAGSIAAKSKAPTLPAAGLRIEVAQDLSMVAKKLSEVDGVTLTANDPDLIVTRDRDDVVLVLPNGYHLARFTDFETRQVIDLIRRHLQIQPLMNLTYPRQQFNVGIELIGPYQQRIIRENASFGFEIRAERPAYVLLISVDPTGTVNVLYPYYKSELRPIVPGENRIVADRCRALYPFGTETLKLFAFSRRPAELEGFTGREDLQPGSPWFVKLERLVGIHPTASTRAALRTDAAQAALRLTSYAKGDMIEQ
jgi:hypothetical protein